MTESPEVLIVEDEPVVLRVAGMALAAHGMRFVEATDVAAASLLLRDHEFKVVVTDLKLPGESGFEILRLARALSPPAQVVIITGYATAENALESFRLGSFDFVPKPFDDQELVSVVSRALRFADLAESDETTSPADRFLLGRHSWVRLDPDGSASFGAAETVVGVVGPLAAIDCLEEGLYTVQGECFCRLTSVDGLIHRVWAPLSGRIIMLNSDVSEDLDLIHREPFAAGWLVRVIPSNLEKELPNLIRAQDLVLD